jgi:hypothetical protein
VRFPCVHAAASTPVQRPGVVFARLARPYQPSPIHRSGRPARRPFRGLLGVYSRCGLHTRAGHQVVTRLPEGFSHFVTSIAAPVASGWSDLAGWGLHPLESAALPRRTVIVDIKERRVIGSACLAVDPFQWLRG